MDGGAEEAEMAGRHLATGEREGKEKQQVRPRSHLGPGGSRTGFGQRTALQGLCDPCIPKQTPAAGLGLEPPHLLGRVLTTSLSRRAAGQPTGLMKISTGGPEVGKEGEATAPESYHSENLRGWPGRSSQLFCPSLLALDGTLPFPSL